MKRWQGPGHAYAEARRAHEQREDARHERWKENNPKCDKCGDRQHVDKMTDIYGEDWCTYCISEHAFECSVCGETHSDEYLTDVDLTMGEYVCDECDEKCAADKTRHHAPVEIPIGHMEYVLWTMENAAKDEPYEGTQPGNAKKWLRESIDRLKQSMPDADHEATNDAMDALSESMNPVGGE